MTSWIYLFSQFTSEALLFELLIIFILICVYTSFWILRKRRFGSIDSSIPSGPIKAYLNELITHAEQLRLQLFGLLTSSDFSSSQLYGLVGAKGLPPSLTQLLDGKESDAVSKQKIDELELKILEQAKQIESVNSEKSELAKELEKLRTSSAEGVTQSDQDFKTLQAENEENKATIIELEQKIQDLEGLLSEYHIIEDDLAQLKTLQQENALLKSSLSSNGIPVPSLKSVQKGAEAPAVESSGQPQENASPLNELQEKKNPDLQVSSNSVKADPDDLEADLVQEFEKMLKG